MSEDTPLLIMLVNNQAGGIFNLLPLADKEESKDYLELLTTPHQLDFSRLVNALELPCLKISDKEQFQQAIDSWNEKPKLQVLEIMVEDQDNVKVYRDLRTIKL